MVLSDIIERIRDESLGPSGLRLTAAPLQRLWTLEGRACERLRQRLVEDRFLVEGGDSPLGSAAAPAPPAQTRAPSLPRDPVGRR